MDKAQAQGVLARMLVTPALWERVRSGACQKVIFHWTGGAYRVSALDRKHYHAIIEQVGKTPDWKARVHWGNHTPADNLVTGDSKYAAHTKDCNTKAFGLAVACMGDTETQKVKQGGPYGAFPLTSLLWERGAQMAAEVCFLSGIPVTTRTVLQHGEVEKNLGIDQNGKWDCTELPFWPEATAAEVCENFRDKVRWYVKQLETACEVLKDEKLALPRPRRRS